MLGKFWPRSLRTQFAAVVAGVVVGAVAATALSVYVMVLVAPVALLEENPLIVVFETTSDSSGLPAGVLASETSTSPAAVDAIDVGTPGTLPYGDVVSMLAPLVAVVAVVLASIGALVAWIVAGRIVAPVSHMSSVAQEVGRGELGARTRGSGRKDELDQLGSTFNAMLDALQESLWSHQRFAANASHELRTPLAIARTVIDVELSNPDDLDHNTVAVLSNLRDLNIRSLDTIDALLDLADAHNSPWATALVDVSEVVACAFDDARIMSIGRGIATSLNTAGRHGNPAAVVHGHRHLLARAFDNVIRNAAVHNYEGGWLSVEVTVEGDTVHVVVENTGNNVSDEELGRLAEPFYRTRSAESATNPGHGLGLSIAAAVVERHHGSIAFHSRSVGGLKVTVSLPISSATIT